jgi:hypothetical protein
MKNLKNGGAGSVNRLMASLRIFRAYRPRIIDQEEELSLINEGKMPLDDMGENEDYYSCS